MKGEIRSQHFSQWFTETLQYYIFYKKYFFCPSCQFWYFSPFSGSLVWESIQFLLWFSINVLMMSWLLCTKNINRHEHLRRKWIVSQTMRQKFKTEKSRVLFLKQNIFGHILSPDFTSCRDLCIKNANWFFIKNLYDIF